MYLKAASWGHSCLTYSSTIWTLRLYADNTTTLMHPITTFKLWNYLLNQDLKNLSQTSWFASNYLLVHGKKTQALSSNCSSYWRFCYRNQMVPWRFLVSISTINCSVFKDNLSAVLKKVYAKTGALRRLRKLVPVDISSHLIMLYKAYTLPYLEYCSPLLLAINKTRNKKLESANYYAFKALTASCKCKYRMC